MKFVIQSVKEDGWNQAVLQANFDEKVWNHIDIVMEILYILSVEINLGECLVDLYNKGRNNKGFLKIHLTYGWKDYPIRCSYYYEGCGLEKFQVGKFLSEEVLLIFEMFLL